MNNDHLDMKVHHVEGDTIHILTVITGAIARMAEGQEPLGAEFETVWDENVDALYQS